MAVLLTFWPYSVPTISGTALQERAHSLAIKNETMRALFAELSSETMLADRAEITVVAQKTVTNADIITIDRFCLGKVATVVTLVTKIDPAEDASDSRL